LVGPDIFEPFECRVGEEEDGCFTCEALFWSGDEDESVVGCWDEPSRAGEDEGPFCECDGGRYGADGVVDDLHPVLALGQASLVGGRDAWCGGLDGGLVGAHGWEGGGVDDLYFLVLVGGVWIGGILSEYRTSEQGHKRGQEYGGWSGRHWCPISERGCIILSCFRGQDVDLWGGAF